VTTSVVRAPRPQRPRGRWRRRLPVLIVLVILALVLIGYVVGPMVATARRSFSTSKFDVVGFDLSSWTSYFANSTQTGAILGSVWVAVLSVVCAGALGTIVAILLTRFDFPGRKLCQVLVMLPIALPPLMGVWAFKLLFGVGGRIPYALSLLFSVPEKTFWLQGLGGVLIVHAMTMYPYFYLSVTAAIRSQDSSLEEAAASLGASRKRTWVKVLLPLLTPALVAGGLLTFMSAMSSYTAPLLFQYTDVMTQQIVIAKSNGDMTLASVISTVLALVSILFLVIIRSYEQRRVYRTQSKGGARRRAQVTAWWRRLIVAIVAIPVSIFLILPLVMIFLWSITAKGGWLRSILPTVITSQWYVAMFKDPKFWTPVTNSLLMSLVAVTAAVVLGAGAAYVISRLHFKGKLVLDIAVMLPWALPGTVVAINLITAFSTPSPFTGGQVLIGTFAIVPLAYFVRFNPLIFRSSNAALALIDPNLEDAARSLGSSWWYAFRRVTLPLMSRGIMAGALLAFVDGVGEFVASVLLYTPNWVPLSIAINNENYQGNYGTGAVYGMIQVVLVLIVVIVTQRGSNRNEAFSIA
jgi:iron(III) transport system permease protein